ncbi:hypothetical protein SAMN05444416_11185 [Thermoactinomyces sp. DSM 45892]|nr:hypothetical protein SAMN05444416_11185 [Thermoactinomyces sp. DSM 45892]
MEVCKVENTEYDATYKIGNTTIHVVAPKITEEEKQRRLEEIKCTIISLHTNQQIRREIARNTKKPA